MTNAIRKLPGALIVWILSYLFFIATLAANFSAAHDSINYLYNISKGSELFHQHHLLYHFMAHGWLQITQPFFPTAPEFYLIEAFTALWGSSSLAVLYLFFRDRFLLPALTSAAGIAIIAFSYGMWFYSINVEVYAPPIFFLASALYLVTSPHITRNDAWKIALLHSLAILFHQANILFALTVIVVFYSRRKQYPFWSRFVPYSLTGILVTGGTYFFVGWFIEGHYSFSELLSWMQGYTVGHGYWQPLSWKTPLHVLTGFGHAFFGGHFIFQLPFMEGYMQRSFQSHGLSDEQFLASAIRPAVAWMLTLMTVLVVILISCLVFRFVSRFRSIMGGSAIIIRPILTTLMIYSVFFCFWMPEILDFWIWQMVLVWMLLIGSVPVYGFPFRIRPLAGLLMLSGLMFCINYYGSIRWLQRIDHDYYYMQSQKVKDLSGPADLVVVEDWILKDYLRYFSPAVVISEGDADFDRLKSDSAVREAVTGTGKVFLLPRPNTNLQERNGSYIDSLLLHFDARKKIAHDTDPLIYKLY